MGFDTKELLRDAGYTDGDFVPVRSHQRSVSESTSTDTFTLYQPGVITPMFKWADEFSTDANTQALLHVTVIPSTDQIDVKLTNATDGEDVFLETGLSSVGDKTLGPVDYQPTTKTATTRFNVRFRNNDNSTTVSIKRVNIVFGVKL